MSDKKGPGHISENGFRRMSFSDRYKSLKEKGEHIAYRIFGGYQVHLYIYEGLYVEVWTYIALRQILWIEPLRNEAAWKEYLESMELPNELRD